MGQLQPTACTHMAHTHPSAHRRAARIDRTADRNRARRRRRCRRRRNCTALRSAKHKRDSARARGRRPCRAVNVRSQFSHSAETVLCVCTIKNTIAKISQTPLHGPHYSNCAPHRSTFESRSPIDDRGLNIEIANDREP